MKATTFLKMAALVLPLMLASCHSKKQKIHGLIPSLRDRSASKTPSRQKRQRPQTSAALCFFKENVLFMGTKSHEFCLYVYPPDEVFEQEIKKLGVWEDASAYMKEFMLNLHE